MEALDMRNKEVKIEKDNENEKVSNDVQGKILQSI